MPKGKLTLKIILFLIFSDLLETFTQFCFKKSALSGISPDIKDLSAIFLFIKTAAFSPFLWMALVSVFITLIVWSTILSKIDLSVAVPVASSSYILIPLVSIIFLHEKISLFRWSGIIFILIGVIFVSLSTKKKETI
ncbi:MAG: EamA family transporter [Candidatus Omnitrophica bacterium]|nr:EamA family transporter [Candidatus Omnitrophota bacterium]